MNLRTMLYDAYQLRKYQVNLIDPSKELELAQEALARLTPQTDPLVIHAHPDGGIEIEGAAVEWSLAVVHMMAAVAEMDRRSGVGRDYTNALEMVLAGRNVKR